MQAVILSIGDELVLGQTVDTNSAYLSAQLARMGIGTLYHQTVADDPATISKAIRYAAASAPLVLISGGLGPTDDDLTRQALAGALGVELVLHDPSVDAIRQRFARSGREMPDRNKVQALHPRGTQIIPNTCGTAPGIKARLAQTRIFVAPGVPHELVAMFETAILPELEGHQGERNTILTTKVNTFGLGESTVAEKLGDLCRRDRNPLVGTTVADGIVSVRIRSEFADIDEARSRLNETTRAVEACLGAAAFGREEQSIQQSVVELLQVRALTVCTAESCTGGLLGKMITDVPGSSSAYVGGWITYSNRMKRDRLGVDEELIERHGAVSEPVARAMGAGAVRRSGAELALAVTGIAGPEGGTDTKPVGTVFIAFAVRSADANGEPRTEALRLDLLGDRPMIRDRASKSALQMLRLHLLGESFEPGLGQDRPTSDHLGTVMR